MTINMSGKWRGQYTYGDYYPEDLRGKSVDFWLICIDSDGSISGTFTDEETKDIFTVPGTFRGFIEDDFISLIKTYPCYWDMDENGSVRVLEDVPSPEIHYTGQITDGLFEGIWEISVAYKFEDGHTEQYEFDGTWSMFKI
jgi:hypothetical protein